MTLKGYGPVILLLAEAALFLLWLIVSPRVNLEWFLYRNAKPVSMEEAMRGRNEEEISVFDILTGEADTSGWPENYAGYPCSGSSGSFTSAKDLEKQWIAALQADVSQLTATGIYKQVVHRSKTDPQRGYYASNSRTYGITAPQIIRSRWTRFWLKPYADYAQYYLLTFPDGSRTWLLVDDSITKIPRRGKVTLPLGYRWDEGADRFLNEKEKEKYHITDEDGVDGCMDLYSGWLEGKEMERYQETLNTVRAVTGVLLVSVIGITILVCFIVHKK